MINKNDAAVTSGTAIVSLREALLAAENLIEYLHRFTVVPDSEMANYANEYMNTMNQIAEAIIKSS